MNHFLEAISKVCEANKFDDKWLVAPDKRTGNQWLETIARNGHPTINLHVKTLKSMALDIAALEMTQLGVTMISAAEAEV